jgi:hypothetical protein
MHHTQTNTHIHANTPHTTYTHTGHMREGVEDLAYKVRVRVRGDGAGGDDDGEPAHQRRGRGVLVRAGRALVRDETASGVIMPGLPGGEKGECRG